MANYPPVFVTFINQIFYIWNPHVNFTR